MKRICLIALLLVLILLTACDKNDNLVQSENNSQTGFITSKNEKMQEITFFEEDTYLNQIVLAQLTM